MFLLLERLQGNRLSNVVENSCKTCVRSEARGTCVALCSVFRPEVSFHWVHSVCMHVRVCMRDPTSFAGSSIKGYFTFFRMLIKKIIDSIT